MSKAKTYFLTFILSLLISTALGYFLYTDSFKKFESSFLASLIKPKEEAVKVDSTIVKKDMPEPVIQFEKYIDLKKNIGSFLGDDIGKFSQNEIDSLSYFFQGRIDTLAENHQQFIMKINELNRTKLAKIDSLNMLKKANEKLLAELEDIKKGATEEEEQKEEELSLAGLKYLSATYNTMKPKSVSEEIAQMDNEKAIKILMKMNKRKAGKVLAELPQKRAAEIAIKMVE